LDALVAVECPLAHTAFFVSLRPIKAPIAVIHVRVAIDFRGLLFFLPSLVLDLRYFLVNSGLYNIRYDAGNCGIINHATKAPIFTLVSVAMELFPIFEVRLKHGGKHFFLRIDNCYFKFLLIVFGTRYRALWLLGHKVLLRLKLGLLIRVSKLQLLKVILDVFQDIVIWVLLVN
jgi:hypothetical protein